MLSQPKQVHGMLQFYHPILRSRPSVFRDVTLLLCIVLYCPCGPHRSSSSCHLSLLFGVLFAQDTLALLGKHGYTARSTSGL